MSKSAAQRVVAQHLTPQDTLEALTQEVGDLESLAADIQMVVDTFTETVPMPHVGRIAALQILSQKECFAKCEQASRHSQRVINRAFAYLQSYPGNPGALAVVRDAGMLLERFNLYRARSREMLSAIAQKIVPTALRDVLARTVEEVRGQLREPNRLTITYATRFVQFPVGDHEVDGLQFTVYLMAVQLPKDTADGLPRYQQYVLTQNTLGDTNVYLTAIDLSNVNDPTQPQMVGALGAGKKILGYLKGWANLLES